ncbi:MAG: permease [Planctomycetes bacterium]|nr:permease [Planctomycetota bacterium]
MTMLIASLLALAAGPVLHRFSRPDGPLRSAIDGFTFVSMIGLILGHILPEAHAVAGWWALGLATLGIFGPTLLESWVKGMAKTAHRVAILLGVLGLVAHAAVDGMALVTGAGDELSNQPLAMAVILHRIPAGMTLWWLLAATRGKGPAAATLSLMAVSTVAGFWLGADLSDRVDGHFAALFQALVGGALLHVVLHRVRDEGAASADGRHWAGGIGALCGIVFVAYVLVGLAEVAHGHAHDHDHAVHSEAFSEVFLGLALQAAPALALAFLLAGMIQVFLPKATTAWMRRGGTASQALRGVAFGLPLPICSCGVVPVYRSIVAQGAPLPAALAFLVATPELGLDAVLMSWPLLGPEMTIVRVGGAFLLALAVGVVVGRMGSKLGRPAIEVPEEPTPVGLGPRVREAFRLGAGDLFDSTAPWILLGLFVAALAAPLLSPDAFAGIPLGWQVPLFALLGMPVYVCAAGATPLVAIFLLKGISPGAALAFLLTGPATNVTTYGLLSRLHGSRLALTFAGAVALFTIGLGYLVDAFVVPGATLTPPAHEHAEGTTLQWIALGILALMTIASITRQGARGFVGRVLAWAGDDSGHVHESPDKEKPHCCH